LNGKPFPFCGGTLLRKEYPAVVLTAAHCLYEVRGHKIKVDLYRDDVYPEETGDSGNFTEWKVTHSIYHKEFNSTTFDNDIGLLFLDANLSQFHQYQEVEISNDSAPSKGDTFTVIGYGTDRHNGNATDTVEYSTLSFVERTECNIELTRWWIEESNFSANMSPGDFWVFATETQICAIGNDTDACQGDSGGPLMAAGTARQIGIISTGFGCNENIPSIYTNLGTYYQWIHSAIDGDGVLPVLSTTNEGGGGAAEELSDTQLAIGCGVAGAVLCCCVAVWKVRSSKEAKSEIYDTLREEEQRKTKGATAKKGNEGMMGTGNVNIVKPTEVEMNSTQLIGT